MHLSPRTTTTTQNTHRLAAEEPTTALRLTGVLVQLLDMDTVWQVSPTEHLYEGRRRGTGALRWTATAVDLVIGSNSQVRAVAEVYAAADAGERFVRDFVTAWAKVMELDRFDLHR